MHAERRMGWIVLAVVVVAIVAALALWAARAAGGLRYTIIFEDAKGLQAGDRVQLNGVDVGVVREVELISPQPPRVDVRVAIDRAHAEKVRADSTASIDSTAMVNVSGQKVVAIHNPSTLPAPPPMKSNMEVEGMDSMIELQGWKLKNAVEGMTEGWGETLGEIGASIRTQAENLSQSLRGQINEWNTELAEAEERIEREPDTPQVQQAEDDFGRAKNLLGDFARQMQDKGVAAADELGRQWPRIQEEMAPILRSLHEFGKEYLVNVVRDIMTEIEHSLERMMRIYESQKEVAPPPGTQSSGGTV